MAYRSSSIAGSSGNVNPVVVPVPTGAAIGDIAVVGIYDEGTNAITPPAGFTLKIDLSTSAATRGRLAIYWKRLTAADTGTYDFAGTPTWRHGACALFSGRVATGDPFTATSTVEPTGNSTTITLPALTAAAGDDLAAFLEDFEWANTVTAPGTMTEQLDQDAFEIATQDNVSSGSTGTRAFTFSGATIGKGFLGALAVASGSGGTFTTNAGDATAEGGSSTLTGAATFTTTAGDATAAGGSTTFTGAALFATTAGDAGATGGSSTITGAAIFTTVAGDAAADGGVSTFSGGGASATFTTLVGDAAAAGGASTFTGAALFTTTAGDAAAGGGSSSFTGAALFVTTAGDAPAAGGSSTFSGGSSSTFTTLAGDAIAAGGESTFTAPGTFATVAGAATAAGGSSTFVVAAVFVTSAGGAAAGGGSSTFAGAALFVTTAGDASASGGVSSFIAGEIVPLPIDGVSITIDAGTRGLSVTTEARDMEVTA